MKKRLVHIDIAKAFGMMLIIASHIGVSKELNQTSLFQVWDDVLNSSYVPLFFIISGIFEPTVIDWKKFGGRILKLFKYILLFYIFGIISAGIINGDWSLGHATSKTVIWFLFTLVWITIIMGCIKNIRYSYWIVVLLCVGGCLLSYYERSYMYLAQSFMCIPFYAFGFYLKDFLKKYKFIWWQALLYFIGWLVFFILFYSEQNVSINYISQNYLTFYLTAILGSLTVIEFCKLFRCKFLSYYGRNTIVPMMVQFAIIGGGKNSGISIQCGSIFFTHQLYAYCVG